MTVCVRLPLVAVMVIGKLPTGVFCFLVDIVKADVELLGDVTVTGFVLNVPVLFAGRPVTESVTLPLNVLIGVSVNGNVALAPPFIVWSVVLAEMEKSFTSTTRVTEVLCVKVPSVPVMVKV